MAKTSSSKNIEYTSTTQIASRRADFAITVLDREWSKLKKTINNISDGTKWWEIVFSLSASSALSFFITLITIPESTLGKDRINLFMWVCITASVMSGVFMLSQRKQTGTTKQSILDEMNEIESVSNEAESEDLVISEPLIEVEESLFPDWDASSTNASPGNNSQGVDYKQLSLGANLLSSLTFEISSKSSFWRAGFKLSGPNYQAVPKILSEDSFLFHIGLTDGKLGLSIYINGHEYDSIYKDLPEIDSAKPLVITFERDPNNYVRCYINDSLEFNKRLSSEIFKKAYLVAWGDGHPYTVEFKKIKFT